MTASNKCQHLHVSRLTHGLTDGWFCDECHVELSLFPLLQPGQVQLMPPSPLLPEPPTLRDRFAMAALAGTAANYHAASKIRVLAEQAYALADVMLAAREKEPAK
jgi:hypothetical protein